jgi:hypothetical protein
MTSSPLFWSLLGSFVGVMMFVLAPSRTADQRRDSIKNAFRKR